MLEVVDELQKRGHEATLFLADWDLGLLTPRLPTVSASSFVVYQPYNDAAEGLEHFNRHRQSLDVQEFEDIENLIAGLGTRCRRLVTSADALAKLEAYRPDIIIVDVFNDCGYMLADMLKVPYITFSPTMVVEPLMSIQLSYLAKKSTIPASGSGLILPVTLPKRLLNFSLHASHRLWYYMHLMMYDRIRREIGLHPSRSTLPPRLVLVNSAFPMETPRALPDGIKLVGPLLAKPAHPLTGKLADLAAASGPEGFVYVSFGATFALSSAASLRTLATALSSLNRTVVLQVNERAFPAGVTLSDLGLAPNVHPVAWAPQNDVLGSPHLAAFVTHGGLNGGMDAMYHGVPTVAIPLVVDHPDAAARAEAWGMSVTVGKETLARGDPLPLVEAVRRVTGDPAFRQRAREAGALLRAHPVPPVRRAAEWIEAALAMPPGTGLPVSDPAASLWWFVRESHDVHLALAAGAAAVVAAARRARRALRRASSKQKKA